MDDKEDGMKRALLVEQVDGSFRLPWDSYDVPLSNLEAEADSVEKISDLNGWGEWSELYSVECGSGDPVLYFIRDDPDADIDQLNK